MRLKKHEAERVFEIEGISFTMQRPDYLDNFEVFENGAFNKANLLSLIGKRLKRIEGAEYEDDPEAEVRLIDIPHRVIDQLGAQYIEWILQVMNPSIDMDDFKKKLSDLSNPDS